METANRIKVMIADDESIVRKGLRSTVPWEKFGMEVVADAPNGRKAWEAFQAHRPQVVITDIVMPEMNGIELSRLIKEASPETRILLLSCHRDFEYAQQGMNLGAAGYLLKTAFEDEELEAMLAKFQRELTVLQAAAASDGTTAAERATGRHPEEGGGNRDGESEQERLGTMLYAWLSGHSDKFERELKARTEKGCWQWSGEPVWIYLLKSAGCPDALSTAAKEMKQEPGAVIRFGEEQLYWLIPASGASAAESLLVERKSGEAKLYWGKRGPLGDANERLQAFQELHKEAELEKSYGVKADEWPEAIWRAVHLLHEHPAAEWSVSDVAGQVGLSRSHFSILFKKTLGDSFVAYQYKRKLKLACGMLRDTSLTMQDIAERSGLNDSKYFSKWFKRCTGETPSHYRARQKDEALRTD